MVEAFLYALKRHKIVVGFVCSPKFTRIGYEISFEYSYPISFLSYRLILSFEQFVGFIFKSAPLNDGVFKFPANGHQKCGNNIVRVNNSGEICFGLLAHDWQSFVP